jgi:hypothetical protein
MPTSFAPNIESAIGGPRIMALRIFQKYDSAMVFLIPAVFVRVLFLGALSTYEATANRKMLIVLWKKFLKRRKNPSP